MGDIYRIEYEALVYNFPVSDNFQYMDHTFHINELPKQLQESIVPENNPLFANFSFLTCLFTVENGKTQYVSVCNDKPLIKEIKDPKDSKNQDMVTQMVLEMLLSVERSLILTTNAHIFFPAIQIFVYSMNDELVLKCGHHRYLPLKCGKWDNESSIDIGRRLNFHIDKTFFEKFINHKSHAKYKRALEYYYRSFYEMDLSSSFCILCSAIDAITGNSKSGLTKERLAKYSSILFCQPLLMEENKNKMKQFYKLRSDFVHGKGSNISSLDEFALREFVRKFLLAYCMFWLSLDSKHDFELLQKLDEIYEDHSLYVKIAPAAYVFVTALEEHEKSAQGINDRSMFDKLSFVNCKFAEAFHQDG